MSAAPPSPPAARFYDPAHLEPGESIGYLMRRVMSSMRNQIDARLSAHDLTYTQWWPLFRMAMCPQGTTLATLARELESDPAAMTRVLDRLQAKGLIVRERSTADRRVVHLSLTEAGQTMAALVPPVLADVLNGHLSDFTHDEWQLLLRMLQRMLANGEALRQR